MKYIKWTGIFCSTKIEEKKSLTRHHGDAERTRKEKLQKQNIKLKNLAKYKFQI